MDFLLVKNEEVRNKELSEALMEWGKTSMRHALFIQDFLAHEPDKGAVRDPNPDPDSAVCKCALC